jgi:hypothetical protein
MVGVLVLVLVLVAPLLGICTVHPVIGTVGGTMNFAPAFHPSVKGTVKQLVGVLHSCTSDAPAEPNCID